MVAARAQPAQPRGPALRHLVCPVCYRAKQARFAQRNHFVLQKIVSAYLVQVDEGQGMLLGGGDYIEHQRGATPGRGLAIRLMFQDSCNVRHCAFNG